MGILQKYYKSITKRLKNTIFDKKYQKLYFFFAIYVIIKNVQIDLKGCDYMAGGPYNIPRNTKGEGRFLYIFSTKALIVTSIMALLGFAIFYFIEMFINYSPLKIIGAVVFGVIGFIVTSLKIPDSNNFEITRKAGGEYIDQIIIRFIKFKMRKNKICTFFTEEKRDE